MKQTTSVTKKGIDYIRIQEFASYIMGLEMGTTFRTVADYPQNETSFHCVLKPGLLWFIQEADSMDDYRHAAVIQRFKLSYLRIFLCARCFILLVPA